MPASSSPEYMRAYRAANREKLAAQKKAWLLANPGKQRMYTRIGRDRHGANMNARAAAWRVANPERARELHRMAQAVRRARYRNQFVEHVDAAWLLERDGELCHLCGWLIDPEDWHVDHVVPLAKGGTHERANLAPAHPKCNLSKHDKIVSGQPHRMADALEARMRHLESF